MFKIKFTHPCQPNILRTPSQEGLGLARRIRQLTEQARGCIKGLSYSKIYFH